MKRIHGLNIVWAYAPGQYSIKYSSGGDKYKTLINFRNTIDKGNQAWWKQLIPTLKLKYKSFPDRINFDTPVFADKIIIEMRNPVNEFFGIYRVDFFVRNWVIMIKNSQKNQIKESCWTVNTLKPKLGSSIQCNSLVKLDADCIEQIGIGDNRELFLLTPNGMVKHFNSGLCVVTNNKNLLFLDDCFKATKERNDGSAFFIFKSNNSIQTVFDKNYCISIPAKNDPYNYASKGTAKATSTMIFDMHDAKNAISTNIIFK